MEDELAPRRRFNDWLTQEREAHPHLTPDELAERAVKHFADDAALREQAAARAIRRAVEQRLWELGYRPSQDHPGKWEPAPDTPPEN
ncbi:MAG: hypothetical protein M3R02_03825 [Chloroflexota bacterium]|nr:hypothetical protein [Chloroflexota bacterium]